LQRGEKIIRTLYHRSAVQEGFGESFLFYKYFAPTGQEQIDKIIIKSALKL
jgi:hypothetical protein